MISHLSEECCLISFVEKSHDVIKSVPPAVSGAGGLVLDTSLPALSVLKQPCEVFHLLYC